MTKNEDCLIAILKSTGKSLTTREVLSKTKEFPDLCIGCSSGSHIITVGLELYEKGIIIKQLGKGGYTWSLKKKQ